jgi:hypothetical protein
MPEQAVRGTLAMRAERGQYELLVPQVVLAVEYSGARCCWRSVSVGSLNRALLVAAKGALLVQVHDWALDTLFRSTVQGQGIKDRAFWLWKPNTQRRLGTACARRLLEGERGGRLFVKPGTPGTLLPTGTAHWQSRIILILTGLF